MQILAAVIGGITVVAMILAWLPTTRLWSAFDTLASGQQKRLAYMDLWGEAVALCDGLPVYYGRHPAPIHPVLCRCSQHQRPIEHRRVAGSGGCGLQSSRGISGCCWPAAPSMFDACAAPCPRRV